MVKVIIILERHVKRWLLPSAIELFEDAVEMGWDEKNQGLFMALLQMVMFVIQINIFGFRQSLLQLQLC